MTNNALVRTLFLVIGAAVASGCQTPARPKIVVVGLDGLTRTFLDPLVKDHRLPNLEAVLQGAAYGDIETFRPTRSGILWTSVATGKTMEKHGITDWTLVDDEAMEEIERLRLVTGNRRVAATVWEILGEKDHSVGVVNWWVTYPATPVNGVLITDRLKAVMNKRSVADEPDVVYPPSLVKDLKPLFLSSRAAYRGMRKFDFPRLSPSEADQTMFDSNPESRNLYASLLSYVGQDQMVADWALHLLSKGQPDFFAAVLRITDVYAHIGWRFADRATLDRIVPQVRLEALTSENQAVRDRAQRVVEELDRTVATAMLPAYKFADDFVGSIVSAMDPNSILLIVSDHGFTWQGAGYDHNPTAGDEYPKTSPPGIIILKGKGIRSLRIEGARLFDVTPTILYALGEPIGRDMDGRALKEAFRAPLFGRREERFVSTYGTGAQQRSEKSPLRDSEKEMLEDLRSLGYIGR